MATSFGDLLPDRVMSVETYLAGISSDIKRTMTSDLLTRAVSIWDPIRAIYKSESQRPELRISSDTRPDAQCMEGLVELSQGLIDYCLHIQYADTKSALGLDTSFDPMLVPTAMLTWFYAHECQHIVREHNKFLDVVDTHIDTLKAIERDADLCAVASLYRVFQNAYGAKFNDDELRKLVLYCVFWSLRKLADKPQLTHSRPDERYIGAFVKIASLPANPQHSPEVGHISPEMQARINNLMPSIAASEQLFRRTHPNDANDFDLRSAAQRSGDIETVRHWDSVRTAYSIVTGQRA